MFEVIEGVADGNNLHLAKYRAEGSPGNQAPNMAKSVHTDLHHFVYRMRLALHKKMQLSLEQGGAERPVSHLNWVVFLMPSFFFFF